MPAAPGCGAARAVVGAGCAVAGDATGLTGFLVIAWPVSSWVCSLVAFTARLAAAFAAPRAAIPWAETPVDPESHKANVAAFNEMLKSGAGVR